MPSGRSVTCFNPRARRGRDSASFTPCAAVAVSIHAPAGGATPYNGKNLELIMPFQSTRPQGARQSNHGKMSTWGGFNPRARRGRDIGAYGGSDWGGCVSIHAPAGGATIDGILLRADQQVSIHAPAGGATGLSEVFFLLRGRFNPRARRGRDSRAYGGGTGFLVSIHAPAGGATHSSGANFIRLDVSIHAPAGGATTACV